MLKNEKLRWFIEKDIMNKRFIIPGMQYIYYLINYIQVTSDATQEELYRLKNYRDKYGLINALDTFQCELSTENSRDNLKRDIEIDLENSNNKLRALEMKEFGFIEEDEENNAKLKEAVLENNPEFIPGNNFKHPPVGTYMLFAPKIHTYEYHGTDYKGNSYVSSAKIYGPLNGVYMAFIDSTNRDIKDKRPTAFRSHYSQIAKFARKILRDEIISAHGHTWYLMDKEYLIANSNPSNNSTAEPAHRMSNSNRSNRASSTRRNTSENVDITHIKQAMGLMDDGNDDLNNNIF